MIKRTMLRSIAQRLLTVLLLGAAVPLALACGSGSPEPAVSSPEPSVGSPEPSVGETPSETETRWVAGTPLFVQGEGYLRLHQVADSPNGPWTDSLELDPRGHVLAPGQVHRVQLVERHREEAIQDVSVTYYEVEAVLESRPGGPPVLVVPGESVAGIPVNSLSGDGEDDWGPFHIRFPAATISFALADVGRVRIGERTVGADDSVQDVVAAIGNCVEVHVRGACAGAARALTSACPGPAAPPRPFRSRCIHREPSSLRAQPPRPDVPIATSGSRRAGWNGESCGTPGETD